MSNDPVQNPPNDQQQVTVTPQELVAVNLFPQQKLVQVFTRTRFGLRAQETVISFDVIEGLFLSLLQIRLAERGQAVALAPQGTPIGGPVDTGPRAH